MHKKRDFKFGERLRFLRKKAGLTQGDIASSISIRTGSYQRYEYGSSPSRKNLNKIIELFRCSKIWLLHGTGNPYPMDGEFERYSFIPEKNGRGKTDQDKPTPINKVENDLEKVAAPKSEYDLHGGWKARPEMLDDDHNMLGKAFEIIRSKSIYREALAANITAFYGALESEKELLKTRKELENTIKIQKNQADKIDRLQETCNDLLGRIAAIEGKKTTQI